jgi:hypothetical protein
MFFHLLFDVFEQTICQLKLFDYNMKVFINRVTHNYYEH